MFGKRKIPKEERELRAYADTLTQEERYDAFAEYLEMLAEETDPQSFDVSQIRQIYQVGLCFLMGFHGDILDLMSAKLGLDNDWLFSIL